MKAAHQGSKQVLLPKGLAHPVPTGYHPEENFISTYQFHTLPVPDPIS